MSDVKVGDLILVRTGRCEYRAGRVSEVTLTGGVDRWKPAGRSAAVSMPPFRTWYHYPADRYDVPAALRATANHCAPDWELRPVIARYRSPDRLW